MTVEEKLANEAANRAGDLTLDSVCIGVGYTGVKLSNGNGGASYTFRSQLGHACGVIPEAGELKGIKASEAVKWLLSGNLAKAAIGMATVNAVLNNGYEKGEELSNAVKCESDDVVGMVGWFCPLVKKYQNAKEFYIFEQDPNGVAPVENAEILSEEKAFEILPKCNKVVLTATSFINKTADKLLSCLKDGAEVVIVGASTPIAPTVLKPYGVTLLAGTEITDADKLLTILAQGGGGRDITKASKKLLVQC